MTDRQIAVLEKAHRLLFNMTDGITHGFLYELELIIKEQKEINLAAYKQQIKVME